MTYTIYPIEDKKMAEEVSYAVKEKLVLTVLNMAKVKKRTAEMVALKSLASEDEVGKKNFQTEALALYKESVLIYDILRMLGIYEL